MVHVDRFIVITSGDKHALGVLKVVSFEFGGAQPVRVWERLGSVICCCMGGRGLCVRCRISTVTIELLEGLVLPLAQLQVFGLELWTVASLPAPCCNCEADI